MTTVPRTWMTREAYERLREELDHLTRLQATDGADTEASGIDEDRMRDADRRAARMRQIEGLLRDAVVGEAPPDDGVAEPGMVLTVRFDDSGERLTFLLSVREATGSADLPVYSAASPLGTALCGAREGERRTYSVPSGATVGLTLLTAVPYDEHAGAAAGEG